MKMKQFFVLLAATTGLAGQADAAYLRYTLTGDYFAEWFIDLPATPDASDSGIGVAYYDVDGSFPAFGDSPGSTPSYYADFFLYNASIGGGFDLVDHYDIDGPGPDEEDTVFLSVVGPQLYSGDEDGTPTLLTGTFTFTDSLTNPTRTYVLNVTEVATPVVPEPASWAMMIAGFGLVGGALRSRKSVGVSFA